MLGIGVMSGTSLDGVDVALVKIENDVEHMQVELLDFITYPMPQDTKERIRKACKEDTSNSEMICSLNFELGSLFSKAVQALKDRHKDINKQIDFIATHGQTIYHIPKASDHLYASTLQIGEPAILAYEHETTVVSNFRVMDMAAHGEGAPLVPYSEYLLYKEAHKTVVLQNIGGIGNVTVIPAQGSLQDVYAFDTGPGNMIIDEICQRFYHKPYDDGGKIAQKGSVHEGFLQFLQKHPYFDMKPPKSTGREMFGQPFVEEFLTEWSHLKKEDILRTVTCFSAWSIANSYERFIIRKEGVIDRVILGGGGAHNETLKEHLRLYLPSCEVLTQEDVGLSSDAKEAVAFAMMGYATLLKKPSNVMSATGASCPVILGNITYNPKGF